jgi:hypothetical protein
MDDLYLHLHSGDSVSSHVENHAGDFTIDLSRTYPLNGQWECTLTEIMFVSDYEKLTHRIYVCSSFVEDSYVKGTLLPILRSIDVDAEEKVGLIFDPVFNFKVQLEELRPLHIFISDDTLGASRFKIDRLYCTLHFRRRWAR